jgi:hypothetical protein
MANGDAGRPPASKSLIPDVLAKSLELIHDDLTEWEQVCEVRNDKSESLWFTFGGCMGFARSSLFVQREREHAAHATSHRHGLRMPSKTGMDRIQVYEQPGRLALVALTHCNVQTGLGSKIDTVHSLPYGAAAYVFVQNFLKRLSNSSPNQAFPFVSIPQPQLHMFIQRNSLQWSDRSKTECPGPPDMV